MYWMYGRIIEIKENSIVVSGMARSLKSGDEYRQERTVEFRITPETVFKKSITVISLANKITPPEMADGSLSDLMNNTNVRILRVESNEDLFTVNEATALYINYESIILKD